MDKELRDHLQWLLDTYPFPESSDKVFWRSWELLIKWYRHECKEIGESRAFWGLVHRLLDDPTDDDVACILDWVNLDWRIAEGFYPDPTKVEDR
jgi:hypothetical protein